MLPGDFVDSTLRTLAYGAGVLALLFVVVAVLEAACGGDVRRHRSRNFATDLAYGLMYLGGMLVMVWNVVKTVQAGKPQQVRIPAVLAHA